MKTHASVSAGLSGLALLLSLAGCATDNHSSSAGTNHLAPLKLFSDGRDNYTTATDQGENDAVARGYHFCRVEGYVFTTPQPGTTALRQYWSAPRHDCWLLSRDIPKNVERNGAYQFVRIEGYAYTNAEPGTVALKHFSRVRGDNFTFASRQGESEARAGDYGQRHLIHAFVIPEMEQPAAAEKGQAASMALPPGSNASTSTTETNSTDTPVQE